MVPEPTCVAVFASFCTQNRSLWAASIPASPQITHTWTHGDDGGGGGGVDPLMGPAIGEGMHLAGVIGVQMPIIPLANLRELLDRPRN